MNRTNLAWIVDYTPAAPSEAVEGVIRAIVCEPSREAATERILADVPGVRVLSCDALNGFVYLPK